MNEDLISWWKKLKHNEKKVLLANFDFQTKKIDPFIDLYVQYFSEFGVGIRKRLDEFVISQENLQQLIQIEKLVINHISFIDLSIISKFLNLKSLFYSNWKCQHIEEINNQTLIELTLQDLAINNIRFVEKLTKIESLTFISCRNLRNFNSLKKSKTLKKLDISRNGGLINELEHLEEIIVNKSVIYPSEIEYKYYQYTSFKNHDLYKFTFEEQRFILENGSEIQKNNYEELILSEKFNVHIKDFCDWILLNSSLTQLEKEILIQKSTKKNYVNLKINKPSYWFRLKTIFFKLYGSWLKKYVR